VYEGIVCTGSDYIFYPHLFFYTGPVLGTRLREKTGKPETFNKVKLELHVRSLTIDFLLYKRGNLYIREYFVRTIEHLWKKFKIYN